MEDEQIEYEKLKFWWIIFGIINIIIPILIFTFGSEGIILIYAMILFIPNIIAIIGILIYISIHSITLLLDKKLKAPKKGKKALIIFWILFCLYILIYFTSFGSFLRDGSYSLLHPDSLFCEDVLFSIEDIKCDYDESKVYGKREFNFLIKNSGRDISEFFIFFEFSSGSGSGSGQSAEGSMISGEEKWFGPFPEPGLDSWGEAHFYPEIDVDGDIEFCENKEIKKKLEC